MRFVSRNRDIVIQDSCTSSRNHTKHIKMTQCGKKNPCLETNLHDCVDVSWCVNRYFLLSSSVSRRGRAPPFVFSSNPGPCLSLSLQGMGHVGRRDPRPPYPTDRCQGSIGEEKIVRDGVLWLMRRQD